MFSSKKDVTKPHSTSSSKTNPMNAKNYSDSTSSQADGESGANGRAESMNNINEILKEAKRIQLSNGHKFKKN
jgi:hypothetical protein